ncbi:MAG: methyltransferase domain-containing protein [Acidobacteria bacterium]|nr:methyltransferase domain-containing protein [Acidobacteriota bacterium]MCI0720751.1 methyltransferase domain-containing protein [Acidobacteriota bacterium]
MSDSTLLVNSPFDAVARDYDRVFTESLIGRAQRQAVWAIASQILRPGQRILELNCGTGVDAVFLAGLGCEVVGLDSSAEMVAVAQQRVETERKKDGITILQIATEQLGRLPAEADYDAVFSNFGGLNCVAGLEAMAKELSRLVRRGGPVLLCLLNRCCLWEVGYYLAHLRFARALRRWQPDGAVAKLGHSTEVRVHYPSVVDLIHALHPYFRYRKHCAIGLTVPPSYLESWALRHPRLLDFAGELDARLSAWPVVRSLGDHYLAHFERL